MKTVLITGAAGGIGSAIAVGFARAGFNTLLHYNKSEEKALGLVSQLVENGFSARAFQADLTNESEVAAMFSQCGRIDVLVNNAGVSLQKLFTQTTASEWDFVFDSNVKSAYLCSRFALGSMLQSHAGVIINISSMWGETGASCEVAYSASKAAIIGLTKALAKEVAPSGVRVNCISPGLIATKMNSALSESDLAVLADETPLGLIGAPSDVASAALFLASDDAAFITGQVLSVNGGFVI